jgi:hypothetical protein
VWRSDRQVQEINLKGRLEVDFCCGVVVMIERMGFVRMFWVFGAFFACGFFRVEKLIN